MTITKEARDKFSEARPYVERAIRDEELRENVRRAYAAARDVYDELLGDRGVTGLAQRVARDKDLQDNVRTAVDELRTAANRIQQKEDHTTRNTLLLLLGIVIGIFLNPVTGPAARRWVQGAVSGSGDDFGYEASGGAGG